MSHTPANSPGMFCWVELATSDQAGAKKFYSSLFGWTSEDSPMEPGQFYTMFSAEGKKSAGGYTLHGDQRAMGVPPHWMVYVAVENADAIASKCKDLGGEVLAPPFDVYEFGRMAVLKDTTGAVFSIWQPKSHPGIGLAGANGTFCWADLSTGDQAKAKTFYAGLFGWEITTEDEDPDHNYFHIKTGEHFIGGIPPVRERSAGFPSHWLIYFHVADCDAFAEKAKKAGAQLYVAPMTVENVGRMAVVADPQGAAFALFQPMPRQK